MVTTTQALVIAKLLWPEFVTEGPATFLRNERAETPAPIASFKRAMEAECFVNHVHILDKLVHSADLPVEPFWNVEAPDFLNAIGLAGLIAEAWASKLARDFPDRRFAVFATRDDNPIVRFHTVLEDAALWMDLNHVPSNGSVCVILVGPNGLQRRIGRLAPAA